MLVIIWRVVFKSKCEMTVGKYSHFATLWMDSLDGIHF